MPENTCPGCGCDTSRTTTRTPIDRSLAFTALLELYPGFGTMTDDEASPLISDFLNDWYSSGHTSMYDYAREWVPQDAAKTQPVTGAPQPDVDARRAGVAQMRDGTLTRREIDARPQTEGNPYTAYTPESRVYEIALVNGEEAATEAIEGAKPDQGGYRAMLAMIPGWRSQPGSSSSEPRLRRDDLPGYGVADLLSQAGWVPHDGTMLADELASQYESQARIAFWNEVERRCLAALPHREVDNYTQLGNRFIICACGHRESGGIADSIAAQNFAHHLATARAAKVSA